MLSMPNFADRLCGAVREKKSILCCGLDPQLRYMPPHMIRRVVSDAGKSFEAIGELFASFTRRIINAVKDFVVCVKPQRAFYEAYGNHGIRAFEDTVEYAQGMGLLVVADAKRNDGGDTADAYADGYIGEVPFFGDGDDPTVLGSSVSPTRADCLTVTPYIGEDCVGRFVKRVKQFGTGIFVVTKTSFKPNSAVEQLVVDEACVEVGVTTVWQEVAKMVGQWGEGTEGAYGLRNVGVVMGATYPEEAVTMRQILPDSIFLVPGYGSQGAGPADAVVGVRSDGFGAIINSSRALTYSFRDLKDKDHGCPMRCEPDGWYDIVRGKAEADRDILVEACKQAGKWPF